MPTTLINSLAESWLARYQRAATTLAHAEQAPALFKPERIERVQDEATTARAEYLRWSTEVAR